MAESLAVFAFHAERLERDYLWSALTRTLDGLERGGIHVTCFVHPLTAIRDDVDIAHRIRELAERGHEIAQRTHFYGSHEETKTPPGRSGG